MAEARALVALSLSRAKYYELTPGQVARMWAAYREIERAADIRAASINVALYNCHRDSQSHPQPFTLAELYPGLAAGDNGTEPQTEDIDATVRRLKAYTASLPPQFRGRRKNHDAE
jgi:hypothetical protein